MTYTQIIVLATPVFLALMALDWWIGRRRGRDSYRLHDAMASVGLGMISQLSNFLARAVGFGVYVVVYQEFSFWKLPADSAWLWPSGLLLYDFLYYWNHRAGHRIALFWAAHAVHHQSQDYNLSTALRQPATGWLAGWVFYLPMALLGYPPLVFAVVALIDLLYQYWVHTQQIDRLGWFDRWFSSPSNHRVHHAVNDEYLDKNYGGILIFWDRMFGTFTDERDDIPCVYGTRLPLRSWNPLRAILQVYTEMVRDTIRAARWRDKLRIWLKPPGWRPADVAARFPKEAFDISRVEFYDPAMAPAAKAGAAALFLSTLGGVAWLLWNADRLGDWQVAGGTAVAIVLLNIVSWFGKNSSTATQREISLAAK
jgi:sterol desaturase/sphingolipid hydroxylase (fatty acid hydroxylase superfamily)